MKREQVILELAYKRGAPADTLEIFRAWRDSERIDVRTCGEVEIAGRRYVKTTAVFYVAIKGNR